MRTPRHRRREGRRKTRKQTGGVAWADTNPDQVWGYHLTEDIIHDELLKKDNPDMYAMSGIPDAPPGEDKTMKKLFELARADPNFIARENAIIEFSINKGTETFQAWNPPILYPSGNNKIGIVQDAGKFITGLIGAQNVITFGHVLDPAGTTITPKTNPMYYQPPPGTSVTIGLQQFGFDPKIIDEIVVADFQGGARAKCAWHFKGAWVDAVTKKALANNTPIGDKTLNNPSPDDAGFFVSREDAIIGSQEMKIGKTLGDTMLVASAMGEWGPTPNIMRGIPPPPPPPGIPPPPAAPGKWTWFAGNPEMEERPAHPTPPFVLALKTIDRLNHVRAVLKDVPSILDTPVRPSGHKFTFFPGEVKALSTLTELQKAYNELPTVVNGRYNDLISEFQRAVAPNGVLQEKYARFSAGNSSLSGIGLTYGGTVFQIIATRLKEIRDRVAGIFGEQASRFEETVGKVKTEDDAKAQIKGLTLDYQTANEFVNRLTPATTEILTNKGLVKQAIVIITAPSGGYTVGPFARFMPIKIVLHGLFMKITQNIRRIQGLIQQPGGGGMTIEQALTGIFVNTEFDGHFLDKVKRILPPPDPTGGPALPPPQIAGSMSGGEYILGDQDRQAIDEFVNGLMSGYVANVVSRPIPLSNIELERLMERAPLLIEFARYARITRETALGYLQFLNFNRHTAPLYSTYVLDELIDEVNGIYEDDSFFVDPRPAPPGVITTASPETVIYNAFVFRKNAEYAEDPGMTNEPQPFSDLGFRYIARLLRSRVIPISKKAQGKAPRPRIGSVKTRALPSATKKILLQDRDSRRRTFRRPLRNKQLKPLHRPIETGVQPA